MDRQVVYDIIRDHLMTQQKHSRAESKIGSSLCAYRGHGGTMCAIGVLIPDSVYHPDLEGEGIGLLPRKVQRAIGATTGGDINFLADLQLIHDCYGVEFWAEELYGFAVKQGLRP